MPVLIDLPKAFYCIPHDLLVANLNAYGFNRESVAYIYYLKNRKQCVRINNTQSYLGNITVLSSVFHFPTMTYELLYFILFATTHNFADKNTLACFVKNIQELIPSLTVECEVTWSWLNENRMIVISGKFQAFIADKRKQDLKK